MFTRVLIANRGEIAVRITRALREMGIASVAVYSEADRGARHVATADEAVLIGEADASASYLNVDRIIAAAHRTRADAIHPGYGFLAENPSFARRVADEGMVFIGPPPEAMLKLGNKTTARRLMRDSGVPVTPGMDATEIDMEKLAAHADRLGYPVVIKAAMGGGGKGMRVVADPGDLRDAAGRAASEAHAAFCDASIYLEKYLDRPRHVELQILADSYGNVVHLFERDCSIQRRHQKIIEETPSPALDEDLRRRMGAAAVAVARAAGYVNAGTVEFLLTESGEFYFLEVNARLQVEHPITEMVTGIDLVRCQLEIAAGEKLAFNQEDLTSRGHAIECRIYAEDPTRGFMPSPGRVALALSPDGPGVRYDSGIWTGSDVPVHYDPILSKLIVLAEDRERARVRMIRALQDCVVLGVRTPIEFLIAVLGSQPFIAGQTHTRFIEQHLSEWCPDEEAERFALIGHMLDRRDQGTGLPGAHSAAPGGDPHSPWQSLGDWDIVHAR
ncbi:MAG: acetyl-CoA carboxylase biotin carboxylase subunit [Acidobacteria bacterium]|nr:acetyl-CoA carboxylase biotin carboxylase subunit [Acidobacteriota bacterium]